MSVRQVGLAYTPSFGSYERAPVHAQEIASALPRPADCYICFLCINSRKLVNETVIRIKIQFIQNEI
jgi:hypothetical protein